MIAFLLMPTPWWAAFAAPIICFLMGLALAWFVRR